MRPPSARRANADDLHIRAGVHVGEVELVGDDVRGVAMHEAARIMAAAGTDEILVSELTRVRSPSRTELHSRTAARGRATARASTASGQLAAFVDG